MSEIDTPTGTPDWTPRPGPSKEVDPGAGADVPPEVLAEEDFLDAVSSHVDDDLSDLEEARDKVSQWYNTADTTVGPARTGTAKSTAPQAGTTPDATLLGG